MVTAGLSDTICRPTAPQELGIGTHSQNNIARDEKNTQFKLTNMALGLIPTTSSESDWDRNPEVVGYIVPWRVEPSLHKIITRSCVKGLVPYLTALNSEYVIGGGLSGTADHTLRKGPWITSASWSG